METKVQLNKFNKCLLQGTNTQKAKFSNELIVNAVLPFSESIRFRQVIPLTLFIVLEAVHQLFLKAAYSSSVLQSRTLCKKAVVAHTLSFH